MFNVHERRAGPQRSEHHVTIEREQVGENAIDAVAQAAGGAALLVFFEGAHLGSQLRRNCCAGGDAQVAQRVGPFGCVELFGEGVGVGLSKFEEVCGGAHCVAKSLNTERKVDRAGASLKRFGAGGKSSGHADVALRESRRLLGKLRVDAVTLVEQPGNVRGLGGDEAQGSGARTNGGQQVCFAWGAEQPDGALGRLLERLQQHVRGALGHSIRVFNDYDAVATLSRRKVRRRHNAAHIVDADLHLLRGQHRSIGVGAGHHLGEHVLAFFGGARNERRSESQRQVRPARPWRARDEPGVGKLVFSARVRCTFDDAHGLGLPGDLAEKAHPLRLSGAADSGEGGLGYAGGVTTAPPATRTERLTTSAAFASQSGPANFANPTRPAGLTRLARLTRLAAAEWQALEAAHHARADSLTAGHRDRAARHEKHPVEDFLWTYYSVRPGELRRWHPGAGVTLEGAGNQRQHWRYYAAVVRDETPDASVSTLEPSEAARSSHDASIDATIDLVAFFTKRGGTVDYVERLLAATIERTPQFGCFGLHEWAMVYRLTPDQVRHAGLPLRLGHDATDRVVEAHPIACSHFDAYRFFTPDAAPLNTLHPTRENQPDTEQAGCLHAGMDVYKWAAKLGPIIEGGLLLDCFEFARDIREVDMRASPYDVTGMLGHDGLPLTPIAIETAAGKSEYASLQRGFAARGNALRQRVLDAIATARAAHETIQVAR